MSNRNYIVVLVLAACVTFAVKERSQGLLGCPADGYNSESFIAYCNQERYGDYDRGAFWFPLEPAAATAASEANILFLGNSRLQFGLSSVATEEWFSAAQIPYYLLGFTHYDNISFIAPLLDRIDPRAQAYVLNLDLIFLDHVKRPSERFLTDDRDTPSDYRAKKRWQSFHRVACRYAPDLCGQSRAIFRHRRTGQWLLLGDTGGAASEVADMAQDYNPDWQEQAVAGEQFINSLPVPRSCIVLTIVPNAETRRREAQWIADQLELPLIAPMPVGLRTFDGSHLDDPSAEVWSREFLRMAGPRLDQCATRPTAETPVPRARRSRGPGI